MARAGRVSGAVYRLAIRLTDSGVEERGIWARPSGRISEPQQFAFSLRDIIDSMNPELPALWPGGPRQSAERVMFHELKLPGD